MRQLPVADGFTHASTVMPVERSSELASGTVTQSPAPLKDSAPPKRPEAVRVAPLIVPALAWLEVSVTAVPVPSSKP